MYPGFDPGVVKDEPTSPLDVTDGYEASWGTPVVERSHGKAAVFLEPLNLSKDAFARNVVAFQSSHYAGRGEDFFTKHMFVGEVMVDFLLTVGENLEAIEASVRHSLKSILLSPEIALLPSEASNAMKTYFCADGFTQGAMYDVTAELGVHVRSSSVLEDEAYHDSSTFPRAGFYLDEFLQPYTAETDNFFETYGLSNASDTLVRSAIEFYIVLRVIPNKDDPLMYRWMDMTDASLSSLDAYKGHRDSHAQGTPGFVWVPYRTSLSLTRSNYPRFSVERFAKFRLIVSLRPWCSTVWMKILP
jgi:hypothetical protein